MSLYSVKLELISPVSHIPTSQTIFGTIFHFYENEFGTESLENLCTYFDQENPPFLVSSLFIEGTLPVPQDFIPSLENINMLDKNIVSFTKETKKIQYISKKIYKEYIKDLNNFNQEYYKKLIQGQYIIQNQILMFPDEVNDIHSKSVKTTRTRVSVDNNEYYQDRVLCFDQNTHFEFYIDILNKSFEEPLKKVIKKMKYIHMGGHKSIGYNLYNVLDIINVDELKSSHPKLLLSKAVGDLSINYNQSYYQLKEQTIKFNQSSKQVNRKRTIVFLEGSIIVTTKNYIGKVIRETNEGKATYQNILGLLI